MITAFMNTHRDTLISWLPGRSSWSSRVLHETEEGEEGVRRKRHPENRPPIELGSGSELIHSLISHKTVSQSVSQLVNLT